MYSARGSAALPALGFPIRESTDHRLFSVSPWLFAAVHALLRLLVPRHPPCALRILTVIRRTKAPAQGGGIRTPGDTRLLASCAVFKVRGGAPAPHELPDDWSTPATEPVSQNSTACGRRRRPLPIAGTRRGAPRRQPDRHFGSWRPPSAPEDNGHRRNTGLAVCKRRGGPAAPNPGASLERR
jgi:hypothetical protein